jgi:hypothetical protein
MSEWLAFFAAGAQMIDAAYDYAQAPTRRNLIRLLAAIAAWTASAMAPSVRMALAGQFATLNSAVSGLDGEGRGLGPG